MRRDILIIIGGIVALAVIAFLFLFRDLSQQIEIPPQENINEVVNETGLPLEIPDGFSIEIFADGLPGARVLAGPDSLGNFWLSQTKEGTVSLISTENGEFQRADPIFTGLNRPHGLTFDPQDGLTLYIAETDKISRVRLYTEDTLQKIIDLPEGGRHFTRTIGFGPDNRLYVSIGSSCDTCVESDERRAAIYSMNKDGNDFRPVAKGLRNAVFFTRDPVTGRVWATEMGRDFLGDDLPPDEINIIKEGEHYGWPWCYGKQVRDTTFSTLLPSTDFCETTEPSFINIQAHSAPLGLAFIPEGTGWPEEYWLDLLVAYHGSWNRSEPTGYKIVRMKLDDQRNFLGVEDFITGWFTPSGVEGLTEQGTVLGRPVDILTLPGGVMYVSDDAAGVIYKIVYVESQL